MNEIRTVALIGNGNVANALGHAWQRQGIHIAVFCNRSGVLPEGFETNDATIVSQPRDISSRVDAVLIATSDDAVFDVIAELPAGPFFIHFSGCLPNPKTPGAVLWPIQSIVPGTNDSNQSFPMAISCDSEHLGVVTAFADLIASEMHVLTELERQTAHITAVFAANFTNHCFAIAQELCERAGLSWELFRPITECIALQGVTGISAMHQTGPSIRKDQTVIDAHQELLDQHPEFKSVYSALNASIQSFHHSPENKKQ